MHIYNVLLNVTMLYHIFDFSLIEAWIYFTFCGDISLVNPYHIFNKSAKWHCGRHTLICKKNTN